MALRHSGNAGVRMGITRDPRDLQWCYWRGELVLARKEEHGRREFVVHGSHWRIDWKEELHDEEGLVFGEGPAQSSARTTMKRLLRVLGLTVKT